MMGLNEQLRQHLDRDVRFLFKVWLEGVVISVLFQRPVAAPAPDSAVSHGWLMRLGHTRQGFPLFSCVCSQSSVSVLSPVKAFIDHGLFAVFGASGDTVLVM